MHTSFHLWSNKCNYPFDLPYIPFHSWPF
jgi:hypothetical protein